MAACLCLTNNLSGSDKCSLNHTAMSVDGEESHDSLIDMPGLRRLASLNCCNAYMASTICLIPMSLQ